MLINSDKIIVVWVTLYLDQAEVFPEKQLLIKLTTFPATEEISGFPKDWYYYCQLIAACFMTTATYIHSVSSLLDKSKAVSANNQMSSSSTAPGNLVFTSLQWFNFSPHCSNVKVYSRV